MEIYQTVPAIYLFAVVKFLESGGHQTSPCSITILIRADGDSNVNHHPSTRYCQYKILKYLT